MTIAINSPCKHFFFFFFFKKCERLGCMILISDLTPGYLFLRSLCPASGKGSWNIVIHFSLWPYCRAVRHLLFVLSFPFCHQPSTPQLQALFEKGTYQTLSALSCMSSCSKAFRSQKRALALKYVYVYLYIYRIYMYTYILCMLYM